MKTTKPAPRTEAPEIEATQEAPAADSALVAMRFREALDDGIRRRAKMKQAPPSTVYDLKTL